MKTIISNSENLEKLKNQIKKSGHQALHILSDFDRTLTYGTIGGIKTPSIISMLRDGKHLKEGYAEKAHALFDKYHPIEIDPEIPIEEKKKMMQEWWETHNRLLIESGLSRADLEDIVEHGQVKFREGILEFLDFLHKYNIPLVIISASGCGDAIKLFFQKIGKDYPNHFYITNQFNWDENGKAISSKGPIVHCANKDETVLENLPEVSKSVENRRNVILLGDDIKDLKMVEGFDYQNILKIGFLNFDSDKLRKEYKKHFDIILEGDGDFHFINDLVQEIFEIGSGENYSKSELK